MLSPRLRVPDLRIQVTNRHFGSSLAGYPVRVLEVTTNSFYATATLQCASTLLSSKISQIGRDLLISLGVESGNH